MRRPMRFDVSASPTVCRRLSAQEAQRWGFAYGEAEWAQGAGLWATWPRRGKERVCYPEMTDAVAQGQLAR